MNEKDYDVEIRVIETFVDTSEVLVSTSLNASPGQIGYDPETRHLYRLKTCTLVFRRREFYIAEFHAVLTLGHPGG